ncbi:unnamed protein product [Lathyrus sativus]|nr:unnamed protein product [Lathyrus sativus]
MLSSSLKEEVGDYDVDASSAKRLWRSPSDTLQDMIVLQVYVTMYLNDCQHTDFYEGVELKPEEFDMHVIIETNQTTTRICSNANILIFKAFKLAYYVTATGLSELIQIQ